MRRGILGAAAALAIGASMAPMIVPRDVRPKAPVEAAQTSRQKRKLAEEKAERSRMNELGRRGNRGALRERLRGLPSERVRVQCLINGMSNWQNCQWRRAGSPRALDEVEIFAAMKRRA